MRNKRTDVKGKRTKNQQENNNKRTHIESISNHTEVFDPLNPVIYGRGICKEPSKQL